MIHGANIGMTGSGKTTLEKAIASEFRRRGAGVLILDPFGDPGWDCDRLFTDLSEFIAFAKRCKGCLLVVEEAGDFGRDKDFVWLFTQARHWGHATHYCSQYHAQVLPIVRTNCSHLNLFRVGGRSADAWAEDFGQPEISRLHSQLGQYEFVHATRFGEPKIGKLEMGPVRLPGPLSIEHRKLGLTEGN